MIASKKPMHLGEIISAKEWQGNDITPAKVKILEAQARIINNNRKEMTKERGVIISQCFIKIVSVLNDIGSRNIPPTTIVKKETVNAGSAQMGKELLVEPLSLDPGPEHLTGSQPTVGSDLGDRLKDKYPGYIVEGHLLNHNLHGPGYARWNLTPITKKANGDMERQAERFAKAAVLAKGKVLLLPRTDKIQRGPFRQTE